MKTWSKFRRKQLAELEELLREAETINHGNHCAERILRCEKLAKRLCDSDLNTGRASFLGFLIGQAAGEGRDAKDGK